jgi:hypothetical protein
MEKKRKVYAPFSLTSEAGVAQTPVEGYIDVNQTIYPTINTGTVNENGKWTGVKSDDEEFMGFTKAEAVASGGVVLFPDTTNHPSIDMTGFKHLQFAVKSSRSDTVKLNAVTGPDTVAFANLSPVQPAADCKFMSSSRYVDEAFDNVLNDTSEIMSADAWRLFTVLDRAQGQKNMQIRLENNAGDPTDFEFAFRRLV